MDEVSRLKGTNPGRRVKLKPTRGTDLVGVASEFRLPAVDWEYYNLTTHILRYTYERPEGFAGHFAFQGEGGWRVINLWKDDELRRVFFQELGAERLTKAIHLLGPVRGPDGVTDVKSEPHEVIGFVSGPRAKSFTNIGEDREGRAIGALGGEPVAIELEIHGIDADDYARVFERIGLGGSAPSELITHHAVAANDGVRVFETWSGMGHALIALGESLLPAIEGVGKESEKDPSCFHREYAMGRIALDPTVVEAFGF